MIRVITERARFTSMKKTGVEMDMTLTHNDKLAQNGRRMARRSVPRVQRGSKTIVETSIHATQSATQSGLLQDAQPTMLFNQKPETLNTELAEEGRAPDRTVCESFHEAPTFDEALEKQSLNRAMKLEPGSSFAGFTLLERLGTGSFGVVHKAIKGNSIVALKILKNTIENAEVAERFIREAKVLSQLNHPNIVKVHDFGVANERPYIALEYLEGASLQDLIRAKKLPTQKGIRLLMAKVASGLTYCHSQGIVHRDLKPDNIIIEKNTGRPVLVDFGLVYKDDRRKKSPELEGFTQNLSIKGMIKGTPQFMAPEQAFPHDFGAIGAASDVWAFGATLYYLLTGELLFPGRRGVEVLEPLSKGDLPKVAVLHPEMPKRLAQIIQLCLQQVSIHRPLMLDLQKTLSGPDESFQERSPRVLAPVKSNGLSVAKIAMIALPVFAVVSTFFYLA